MAIGQGGVFRVVVVMLGRWSRSHKDARVVLRRKSGKCAGQAAMAGQGDGLVKKKRWKQKVLMPELRVPVTNRALQRLLDRVRYSLQCLKGKMGRQFGGFAIGGVVHMFTGIVF